MPRKQDENLVPFTGEQSRDEAVKNGKKGGKASGAARRKKKAMREEFEELLSLTLTNPKLIQNLEGLGIPVKKDTTIQTAILAAMIHQAAKGNVKAYREIRETVNEKTDAPQDVNGGKKIEFVFKDTSMKDESNTD